MKKSLILLVGGTLQATAATALFEADFTGLMDSDFDTDTFISRSEFVPNQWFRDDAESATFAMDQLIATSDSNNFRGGSIIFDATNLTTGTYTLSFEVVGISAADGLPLAADAGALVRIAQARDFEGFGSDSDGAVFRAVSNTFERVTTSNEPEVGPLQSTGVFTTSFDYTAVAEGAGASAISFGLGATQGSNGTSPVSVVFDNVSLINTTAVPEPSTTGLLALVVGMGAFYRRRKVVG